MERSRVKYGLLHNHTMESRRDSAMSVQTLVDRAKELGAPAVALTDHGVMTGYIDFARCCEEAGIKPVVGVEAYIEEGSEGRKHLILMSKNDKGFRALSKFTTDRKCCRQSFFFIVVCSRTDAARKSPRTLGLRPRNHHGRPDYGFVQRNRSLQRLGSCTLWT